MHRLGVGPQIFIPARSGRRGGYQPPVRAWARDREPPGPVRGHPARVHIGQHSEAAADGGAPTHASFGGGDRGSGPFPTRVKGLSLESKNRFFRPVERNGS